MIALLMGVLHRLADGDEQLQPGPHGQSHAVAVLRDRLALHELHHEERLAGPGRAAVVDAGDVRVVHQRQRLPLGVEAGQHGTRVHAEPDQLQGDHPLDRPGLLGEVDGPHPPLAEHLAQRVPAGDHLAGHGAAGRMNRCTILDRGSRAIETGSLRHRLRRETRPRWRCLGLPHTRERSGLGRAGGIALEEAAGPLVGGQ